MDIEEVESTDRKPAEIAAFGLAAFGNIFGTAGVVITVPWVAILGLVLALIGAVALFALES